MKSFKLFLLIVLTFISFNSMASNEVVRGTITCTDKNDGGFQIKAGATEYIILLSQQPDNSQKCTFTPDK